MKTHSHQPIPKARVKKVHQQSQIWKHPYIKNLIKAVLIALATYFYYDYGLYMYTKCNSLFFSNRTELSKDEGRVLRYRDNTMLPIPAITICFPVQLKGDSSSAIIEQFNRQLSDQYIRTFWYDKDLLRDDVPLSESSYRREHVQAHFSSHRRRPCLTIVVRQTRSVTQTDPKGSESTVKLFDDSRRVVHLTLDSKLIGYLQGARNDTSLDVYLHHNRDRHYHQNSFSKSKIDLPTRQELDEGKGQFFVYELTYKTSTTIRYEGLFYSTCSKYDQTKDHSDKQTVGSYRECLNKCHVDRQFERSGRVSYLSILQPFDGRKISAVPKAKSEAHLNPLDEPIMDQESDQILKDCNNDCRSGCYEVSYTGRSIGYLERIRGNDRLNKLKPRTFTLRLTPDVGQDMDQNNRQRLCPDRLEPGQSHDPFCEMQKFRTFTSPLIIGSRDAYHEYFVIAIALSLIILIIVGLCSNESFGKILLRVALGGYVFKTLAILCYGTQNKFDNLSEHLLEGYIAQLDWTMN